MKSEVMVFFAKFFELGFFKRSLNVTFIMLVPKKGMQKI